MRFVFFPVAFKFGVADLHDRRRDVRLNVDNMSYEVNVKSQFLFCSPSRFYLSFF